MKQSVRPVARQNVMGLCVLSHIRLQLPPNNNNINNHCCVVIFYAAALGFGILPLLCFSFLNATTNLCSKVLFFLNMHRLEASFALKPLKGKYTFSLGSAAQKPTGDGLIGS